MSAYVVDPAHIKALVFWSAEGARRVSYYWEGKRRDIQGNEARIASVLHSENVRSVNARYESHDTADGFRYSAPKSRALRSLSPIAIIKACHGYAYQACESDEWETSEAHAIIGAIEAHAVRMLPGYDSAAWSLSDDTTARST
jgi:hypothetical protein